MTNTNAANATTDLIREMQENVAKYGSENTTTYLMVQAINELQRMIRALIEVRRVLHAENERQGGPINDTIWRGPAETLLDFIDAAIGGEQIAAALASPGAVAAPDSTADAARILSQVCDLLHIGKLARTESTILTNVSNVIRLSRLLRAVERDLFPEPELPEDEDDDPYTLASEGLPVPNRWGAMDEADYVAQFRAALVARGAILAADGAVAAEPAACWAISYDGKTPYSLWEYGDGPLLDAEIARLGGTAQKMALAVVRQVVAEPTGWVAVADRLPGATESCDWLMRPTEFKRERWILANECLVTASIPSAATHWRVAAPLPPAPKE